jgi:hypothetical protein
MSRTVTKQRRTISSRAKARIVNASRRAEAEALAQPTDNPANHCDQCDKPFRTLYRVEKKMLCVAHVPLNYARNVGWMLNAAACGIHEIVAARDNIAGR